MGERYFYPFGEFVYSVEIYRLVDTTRILWSLLKAPKGGELEEILNSEIDGSKDLSAVNYLPEEVYNWMIELLVSESN
jgi:hypothetical protein